MFLSFIVGRTDLTQPGLLEKAVVIDCYLPTVLTPPRLSSVQVGKSL